MIEHIRHIEWAQYIPFMLATGASTPKWNVVRFLETLIMAAIIAGITMWSTQHIIQLEISYIKKEITVMKDDMRSFREDFYRPVK